MTIGFREVETPTAEKLADFAGPVQAFFRARVFETDSVDPFQNCIEHGITDPEAIVVDRHTVVGGSEKLRVNKVGGQRIVNLNGRAALDSAAAAHPRYPRR